MLCDILLNSLDDIGIKPAAQTSVGGDGHKQYFFYRTNLGVGIGRIPINRTTEILNQLGELIRIGAHGRNGILRFFQFGR